MNIMRRIALVSFLLFLNTPSYNSCSLTLEGELNFKAKKSVFVYISPQGCVKCIPAFFTYIDSFSHYSSYDIKVFSSELSSMDKRNMLDYIRKYYPDLDQIYCPANLKTFKKVSGIDPRKLKNPSVLVNTENGSHFYPQNEVMASLGGVSESFKEKLQALR
jgi:hypothetical protein